MNRLIILAVFAAILALVWLLQRHPTSRVSRVAFSFHGPRTDVRSMTRTELFRSGRRFLGWGTVFLLVYVVLLAVGGSAVFDSLILLVLVCVPIFPSLMGIGGGLYLLVRGLFRRRDYQPPDDTASSEEIWQ